MEHQLTYSTSFEENKKAHEPLLWIGLVSIIMFFAGLTSAVIVSSTSSTWQLFSLPSSFLYSSIAIVLSSLSYQTGYVFLKKQQLLFTNLLFLITIILSLLFVYFQYAGLSNLYQQGVYATGSQSTTSSSYFYILTVLHIAHLFFGLISLLFVSIKTMLNKYNNNNYLGVKISLTYWHFLGILWVYLYVFLSVMMSK